MREAQTAMSMMVHQSHVLKGRPNSSRAVISIPEIPSAATNRRENLIFTTETRKRNCQLPQPQTLRKQRLVLC